MIRRYFPSANWGMIRKNLLDFWEKYSKFMQLIFQGIWKIYPLLADFAYNKSLRSSFNMAPYQLCMEEKISLWLVENWVLFDFGAK